MTTLAYTVPTAGTDLNAIADPEIATALTSIKTAFNGNIDTTNLSAAALAALSPLAFRNAASNISANPGDLIVAAGGVTVTLPTPAGANVRVGIVAASSVTGASPVTVSFPGQTIYGPGYSGASFLLGMGASFALLQSISSTQYVTVAGRQDTGWVALGLGTGVSASSGTASARLVGNVVTLASTLTTGTQVNGGSTLFTVPASMKPANAPLLNPSAHTASGAVVSIPYPIRISASTGAAAAEYPSGDGAFGVGYKLGLDGLTYPIS